MYHRWYIDYRYIDDTKTNFLHKKWFINWQNTQVMCNFRNAYLYM